MVVTVRILPETLQLWDRAAFRANKPRGVILDWRFLGKKNVLAVS